MIPLIEVSRVVKFIETESRMTVAREWGEGRNGELSFNGYSLFCKMKRALWVDGGGNDSITMGMNLIL